MFTFKSLNLALEYEEDREALHVEFVRLGLDLNVNLWFNAERRVEGDVGANLVGTARLATWKLTFIERRS